MQVPVSSRANRPYESQSDTCLTCNVRVDKARVELARPCEHDGLSVARLPFRHLAMLLSDPYGSRTHAARMRVSHPAVRRTGHVCQCVGTELNRQSPKAGGLQPLGHANAQPTHVVQVARVGVEPTGDHEGLSFAALPVCVPCHVVERPRWDLNPRSPA